MKYSLSFLMLTIMFTGCMDDGETGLKGADSTSSLMNMTTEPAGSNCTYGGVKIELGLDTDHNLILDHSEVTDTEYICNGNVDIHGWGIPELIETNDSGHARYPQVSRDENGNAMAIWILNDGTRDNIWANSYMKGFGWSTPELLETDNGGNAMRPQIAMNGDGDAIAIWYQVDSNNHWDVWANSYMKGTGWSGPIRIESDDGGTVSPDVAIDDNGNTIAVWGQSDSASRYSIWSNRYVNGVGWSVPELLETDDSGGAYHAKVAMDKNGNATAVWYQSDGTSYNIWSNRYVMGTGWGTAQRLETDDVHNAYNPEIAVDDYGHIAVVWYQMDDTYANVWANYGTNGSWGVAKVIDSEDLGHAMDPQIAMDDNGIAIAVWHQNDGANDNIWSNHYTSNWGTAKLIETDDTYDATHPQIAIDANGNAIIVWHQTDGNLGSIVSNRYISGLGWQGVQLVGVSSGNVDYPQIAMDSVGNATVVWPQVDSNNKMSIVANSYNDQ